MRTGLSSVVAPRASLEDLIAGAMRHGLTVLELCAGDGHGVTAAVTSEARALAAVVDTISASHVAISAYRDLGKEDEAAVGTLSGILGAPTLVDVPGTLAARLARAERLRAVEVAVAVVVRGVDAIRDAQDISRAGCAVAWDAAPAEAKLGAQAAALLDACGDALCQVRVAGGGPESTLHEGRGIGELMARLALAGYAGTVILAPSSPSYHVLWDRWLGRPRGFGCGSHASDNTLVTLEQPVTSGDAA